MANFCTSCGTALQPGEVTCSHCGASVSTDTSGAWSQTIPATVPYTAPQTATLNGNREKEPTSFWAYLGLIALFLIPCVGLIAAVVIAFVSKNADIKNFARAAAVFMAVLFLISALIGTLLTAVVAKTAALALSAFGEYAKESGALSENGEPDFNDWLRAFESEMSELSEEFGDSEFPFDGGFTLDENSASLGAGETSLAS